MKMIRSASPSSLRRRLGLFCSDEICRFEVFMYDSEVFEDASIVMMFTLATHNRKLRQTQNSLVLFRICVHYSKHLKRIRNEFESKLEILTIFVNLVVVVNCVIYSTINKKNIHNNTSNAFIHLHDKKRVSIALSNQLTNYISL